MIIVRRVIHKKTTSFGLFPLEQLGQTFQCNFAKRDDISFRRDKKYRHIRDIRHGARRRDEIRSQRQQIKQRFEDAEKVAQNTKQSYREISDPWDEPFSRKVDPKGNPKMPPSPPKVSTGSFAPSVSSGFKTTINSSGIPAPLIGAALGIGAAATAHYFWRKRRSKNGKQIIERVRRK